VRTLKSIGFYSRHVGPGAASTGGRRSIGMAGAAQHVERFSDRFTKPAAELRRRVRGDACTFLVEPAQSRRASGSRAAAAHRAFGGV